MSVSVTVTPSATVRVTVSPAAALVGGTGGASAYYLHTQATPAAVWTVPHNLGIYPSVTVIDSAGSQVIADVSYPSLNTVTITFSAALSGRAALS